MIVTVEKFRKYVNTDVDDEILQEKLEALEILVRKYTNNNFQDRNFRVRAVCHRNNAIKIGKILFHKGDTIQITENTYNNGIYTVTQYTSNIPSISNYITLNKALLDTAGDMLVTLVKYPLDVQQGVINLLKWDLENRDKVGIQSETISRHSVTYFNMDGDNSIMGYPRSLMGFLKPYKKARF